MTDSGTRQRLSPEHRKSLIIAAAKTVLAQHGSRGFNIARVANEARVAIGLVGHHFGGIEELYDAMLLEIVAARLANTGLPPVTEAEALGSINGVIERHFDPDYYSRENLLVWMPVIEHFTRQNQPDTTIAQQDVREMQELAQSIEVLARHRGLKLDAEQIARTFFALLDGLWLRWCYTGQQAAPHWERQAATGFLEQCLGSLAPTT